MTINNMIYMPCIQTVVVLTKKQAIQRKVIQTAMIFVLIGFSSCEEFVTVNPPRTQIISSTVFKDDATAEAAISGLYAQMLNIGGFASGGLSSVTVLCGLSADELTNYSTSSDRIDFFTNSLQPNNSVIKGSLWQEAYKLIYYANSIIEGLNISSGTSEPMRLQLEGEAKFIRAFCYFYIVNLFGEAYPSEENRV